MNDMFKIMISILKNGTYLTHFATENATIKTPHARPVRYMLRGDAAQAQAATSHVSRKLMVHTSHKHGKFGDCGSYCCTNTTGTRL